MLAKHVAGDADDAAPCCALCCWGCRSVGKQMNNSHQQHEANALRHMLPERLMMQPGAVDAAALLATYVAGDADDAVRTSHGFQAIEQREANACDKYCRGC